MRDVVCKEIDRNLIEFGSELGAGEFGAVFEGEIIYVLVTMPWHCHLSCCGNRNTYSAVPLSLPRLLFEPETQAQSGHQNASQMYEFINIVYVSI